MEVKEKLGKKRKEGETGNTKNKKKIKEEKCKEMLIKKVFLLNRFNKRLKRIFKGMLTLEILYILELIQNLIYKINVNKVDFKTIYIDFFKFYDIIKL